MMQMLLFPDPRPLVERLGSKFFRSAPECPGVYLMRDAGEVVLYVGKARNLRKRLAHYRVANPDRLPRRHLRLLRAVRRIELRQCSDEASALAAEAELLRTLRPRFNRAGTWPGPRRFLSWRATDAGFELGLMSVLESEWFGHGPLGGMVLPLRTVLVRLLWCALHPERGLAQIPHGWFRGSPLTTICIPRLGTPSADLAEAQERVRALFGGNVERFTEWFRERAGAPTHPFELAVREMDLEFLTELLSSKRASH